MTDLATLQQHHLLTRLLGIARAQGEALESQQLDQFLSLMDERDQLVSDLVTLDEQAPPANVIPFALQGNSDDDAKAAMGGLIRSILRQDDENELELRRQMAALGRRIDHIGCGMAAAKGYSRTGRRTAGMRLDRAG
ncbi:MAG: hypothetical protein U0531_15660 [Dehalococcoidia bacterium]